MEIKGKGEEIFTALSTILEASIFEIVAEGSTCRWGHRGTGGVSTSQGAHCDCVTAYSEMIRYVIVGQRESAYVWQPR